MSLLVVTCGVFEKEMKALLPDRGDHRLIVLDMGYHRTPKLLQQRIQDVIDHEGNAGAVLVLYGYCGGILNLEPRGVPVVIPKAHDCFDLMLGAEARFSAFAEEAGTYFLSEGWVYKDGTPAEKLRGLRKKHPRDHELIHSIYAGYRRLCFVRTGTESKASIQRAKRSAVDLDWTFTERRAGMTLIRKALAGTWDDEFIVLKPGGKPWNTPERPATEELQHLR